MYADEKNALAKDRIVSDTSSFLVSQCLSV